MAGTSQLNYSVLDRPEVLMSLFHPRPEWTGDMAATSGKDVLIPVEEDVVIGARLHMTSQASPNVLFFHGNGEIVSDYDDFGSIYNRMGINFLPVDYRGYGRSTGRPTVTSMLKDCHTIFEFVTDWLRESGYSGRLIVMGRSLGSASALELAACYKSRIAGLIIESGFAYAVPLLRLLGVEPEAIGFKEQEGFRNVDKIRLFDNPTLIIHAERDQITPFSDAQALFNNASASDKVLLKIPDAGHNDLFVYGLTAYMSAVKAFSEK